MSDQTKTPTVRKRKPWKIVLLVLLIVLLALVLTVGGYFAFVMLSYTRIEDNRTEPVPASGPSDPLQTDTAYVAVSSNIGFGAYTPDFTFFMDGGTGSWAASPESVRETVRNSAAFCRSLQPDFLLLQEVDTDSTRSYHIDESELLKEALPDYVPVFTSNYHSAFLMYPFYQPHGASNSGMMTFSKTSPLSAVRYSLPVSKSVSKLLDLDRCFLVTRYPVANGKEFVLINIHLSAYGTDGSVLEGQIAKLSAFVKAEYDKGNYILCGGDYNHDFTGTSVKDLNKPGYEERSWTQPFPVEKLPDGFRRLDRYKDGKAVASCRDNDIPFGENSFLVIVDGFLASDNVEDVELENVWNGFAYSDHQPVRLTFKLKS